MQPLTQEQILQMFEDFGLADEKVRQQFQELEALSPQPTPSQTFILLDDSTSLPSQPRTNRTGCAPPSTISTRSDPRCSWRRRFAAGAG
jgi:hypothetical protein